MHWLFSPLLLMGWAVLRPTQRDSIRNAATTDASIRVMCKPTVECRTDCCRKRNKLCHEADTRRRLRCKPLDRYLLGTPHARCASAPAIRGERLDSAPARQRIPPLPHLASSPMAGLWAARVAINWYPTHALGGQPRKRRPAPGKPAVTRPVRSRSQPIASHPWPPTTSPTSPGFCAN